MIAIGFRPRRAAAPLLLALLLCPGLSGQFTPDDPRHGSDPRETLDDPRGLIDPRGPAVSEQDKLRLDQLEGPALFTALDEQEKQADLVTALREAPWDLLPWLDELCEQWLALQERDVLDTSAGLDEANALRDKLVRCASLCDEAAGDTAFLAWVSRVLVWSDKEIATFRQAQSLYVQGLNAFNIATTANHALDALTPLRQALERLEPLGPTWETTMSHTLIGRVLMANGSADGGREAMREALRLGRSLRDLDAVWNGLSVLLEAAIREGNYDEAEEMLTEQYRISLETGDEGSANDVVLRLTQLAQFRQAAGL